MDATKVGSTGPLGRMAARECEELACRYGCFREAWDRRDIGRAVVNFERFQHAQLSHMRWEEETLLGEFERHCAPEERSEVLRHRKQHQIASVLAERVMRLLASRMGIGAQVDDELALVIDEVEATLCSHRQSEIGEVCARLDALLSDVELAELEQAFDERAHESHG